jgi:hypothetical protein
MLILREKLSPLTHNGSDLCPTPGVVCGAFPFPKKITTVGTAGDANAFRPLGLGNTKESCIARGNRSILNGSGDGFILLSCTLCDHTTRVTMNCKLSPKDA